jgi:hypothetical protein
MTAVASCRVKGEANVTALHSSGGSSASPSERRADERRHPRRRKAEVLRLNRRPRTTTALDGVQFARFPAIWRARASGP